MMDAVAFAGLILLQKGVVTWNYYYYNNTNNAHEIEEYFREQGALGVSLSVKNYNYTVS